MKHIENTTKNKLETTSRRNPVLPGCARTQSIDSFVVSSFTLSEFLIKK